MTGICWTIAALLTVMPSLLAGPAPADVERSTTPDGVEYGVWGGTPGKPAPTLLVLSGNLVDSFTRANFLRAGEVLGSEGYLCVSIDLPCHGKLARPGYSNLTGWARCAAEGDDFVAEFNDRMKRVLDHLVAEGRTDPARIVATGTSRGGFLAIRYMAFDPRVLAAVGYAPVTDLRRLREFEAAAAVPGVDAMSLRAHVPALVGRPLLMFIGDRDERVGTDAAWDFARRLSAAAADADVASNVELRVVSEPRGHSLPADVGASAARWIRKVVAGVESR